jgi:hypothetical protein
MATLEHQINKLIKDIVKVKAQLAVFRRPTPAPMVPRPPATNHAVQIVEKHLAARGLPLPPAFRAFLRVHDGVTDFDGHLNLLDCKALLGKRDPSLRSDYPDLANFVIALGNTPAFISFDPRTAKKTGEMEVVWVMPDGGEFRYSGFMELLTKFRDELRKTLKLTMADRPPRKRQDR